MRHLSVCPLDCPGACNLLVQVHEGRLESINGNPEHPFTQGVICGKVNRYREIQEGARLLHPMRRTGPKGSGQFQRISWEEAMELLVARFRALMADPGPEAIFPYYYGGTMGLVQRPAVDRLTHRAGFSRIDRTICYPIAEAGWYAGVGKALGPDPREIAASDLVILWGIDAVTTHITLMAWVKKARAAGAKLVVVDPYRTRTAQLADWHLNPRPGTDAALAVAMIHCLLADGRADQGYLADFTDFDPELEAHFRQRSPEWAAPITGLEPEAIRAFADLYGRARAPYIRLGLGMSRQTNGAVNIHAVSCLPAVTGAWQHRGGGALFATGDAFPAVDRPVRRTDWAKSTTRILDMSRLGPLLNDPSLDPQIRALLVMNANPAASCPDLGAVRRGLLREDLFTVVHEQVMSDTARFADLLLPATTFLEHADLYKSYGHYFLQYGPPLLPPRGEARSNHQVVNELACRLGFTDPDFQGDAQAMVATILTTSGLPPLTDWGGKNWLDLAPEADQCHFRQGFPQPDGRFHFRPGWSQPSMPALPDHWPVNRRDRSEEARRYPLDLILPPSLETLNTTFTGVASQRLGPPCVWIHPEDAAQRGIASGDRVAIFNDLGRLTLIAELTDAVRPGLCLIAIGHLAAAFPEGLSVNLLSHGEAVLPAGGPAFHDNRVEVALLTIDETRQETI